MYADATLCFSGGSNNYTTKYVLFLVIIVAGLSKVLNKICLWKQPGKYWQSELLEFIFNYTLLPETHGTFFPFDTTISKYNIKKTKRQQKKKI